MRNANIVVGNYIGSLSRETTFEIKSDGCMEVTLTLFNLCRLCFLVSIDEPLEVVFLELSHIRVVLFFSNLDALIPPVKLLIHGHGFFDFIILK